MNQLVSVAGLPDFRERIFKALHKTDCTSTRTLLVDILQAMDARPSFDWIKERYSLSPTEFKVLNLLLEGKSPRQISTINGTSLNTVRVQITSVYKKTNVSNKGELAALVIQGPQE